MTDGTIGLHVTGRAAAQTLSASLYRGVPRRLSVSSHRCWARCDRAVAVERNQREAVALVVAAQTGTIAASS
jgi:hypothetical protein